MQKHARIVDTEVVETITTDQDITTMFHPDLIWVPCSESVEQGWSYDGSTFLPPIESPVEPPLYIPESITKAQGMAVLIQAGLWADILADYEAIEDPTEKALMEVALFHTNDWRRDSPRLNAAATKRGITQEQLDGMFLAGSKINL